LAQERLLVHGPQVPRLQESPWAQPDVVKQVVGVPHRPSPQTCPWGHWLEKLQGPQIPEEQIWPPPHWLALVQA
jgi:hypothetical protein